MVCAQRQVEDKPSSLIGLMDRPGPARKLIAVKDRKSGAGRFVSVVIEAPKVRKPVESGSTA